MDYIGKSVSPQDMQEAYPGFPRFVHHIMASIANGDTPEEAAQEAAKLIDKGAITTTIEEIERTRLAFGDTHGEEKVVVEIDEPAQ